MRKSVVVLAVLLAVGVCATAQEKKGFPLYSFVVNSVPDAFNYPLVGFVNLAQGSHKGAQVGFLNWNEVDFSGSQVGFINITGGKTDGTQVGFVNVSGNATAGTQVGFVNATESMNGVQVGFVNAVESIKGVQVGFVNTTKKMNGFQLGFVNVAESIEGGVPFGFLSLVKHGGFRALEVSTSEMFPVNVSYKVGVKKVYTSFVASYSQELENRVAVGMGIGSILPLNRSVYLNPEVVSQNEITSDNSSIYSFTLNAGYCLTDKLHVNFGPSIVWNHAGSSNDLFNENFAIRKWELDNHTNLFLGARIGITYVFPDL